MSNDFEALADYIRSSNPIEWDAITRHRNATREILIEFWFGGMSGKDEHRVYEVKRALAGCYRSSISGGQEQWTTESQGPNGEPIVKYREWLVSESGGYIGSFETLEQLAVMILHQLGARNVFVVSDSTLVS